MLVFKSKTDYEECRAKLHIFETYIKEINSSGKKANEMICLDCDKVVYSFLEEK